MKRKRNIKTIISIFACLVIVILIFGLILLRSETVQDKLHEYAIEKKTNEIIESMSEEEKVGQLFMGCFYNSMPDSDEIEEYHLGALLLFKGSFKDMDKASLSKHLEKIHGECSLSPIIAVDEEGGTVNRLSVYPAFRREPFQSPRSLYQSGGMKALISDAHEKNALLKETGIDMNLAPVCDISQNPENFMYQRSLGEDEKITSKYTSSIVKACNEDGIICTLKHFPGYGNSDDTHKGLVVDQRSLDTFKNKDFLPFRAGIDAGAAAVLVSHNIVSEIDGNYPASLSEKTHQILREEMGFHGVIVTDDLSMEAISQYTNGKDAAVAAVLAGNDILCSGDFKTQYHKVLAAVKDGTISAKRLDESVKRILTLKIENSIL